MWAHPPAPAGTGRLFRLALRLDRVRLPLWVAVLAVLAVATAPCWP